LKFTGSGEEESKASCDAIEKEAYAEQGDARAAGPLIPTYAESIQQGSDQKRKLALLKIQPPEPPDQDGKVASLKIMHFIPVVPKDAKRGASLNKVVGL
jgi:hypothetical protein